MIVVICVARHIILVDSTCLRWVSINSHSHQALTNFSLLLYLYGLIGGLVWCNLSWNLWGNNCWLSSITFTAQKPSMIIISRWLVFPWSLHDSLTLLLCVYLMMLLHQLVRSFGQILVRVGIEMVWLLMNTLAVRLKRITKNLIPLDLFAAHVRGRKSLSLVYVYVLGSFEVLLGVVRFTRLLRSSSTLSGWTIYWGCVKQKTVFRNILEILLLPFHLYLL